MVSSIELVGLAAGFMVATGYVPQVFRVWKLKDAHEISLTFNLFALGGTVLWFAYGFYLQLLSVMIWNGANFVLLALLLAVKLKYGMRGQPPQVH
ncbi:MAG: hypothetical protein JRN16_00755 [Nitrososphaerota archaeon]|nr:hypothetical protein [Nitrososphaerota archaeon]MDG7030611.1 hypothetical protein [Nitrososphaerota archaeon]